ncbi:interleukin 17 [Octopus vulgaris]|uniref:Interleukin 17 n=1 Tax=Octopus vulgaris TaxID=6645 RepID=A0AA36AI51_OCTVU|nr:interleukin 17 [Octopus vulgaris]
MAIGNNFFLPAEMAPAGSDLQALTVGDKTCPTSSVSTDIIRERSTCPWYLKITHNSTYFPPSRTEVVCRCTDCLDSDSNHQCVMVYTPMTVLKRTAECVDGLHFIDDKMLFSKVDIGVITFKSENSLKPTTEVFEKTEEM